MRDVKLHGKILKKGNKESKEIGTFTDYPDAVVDIKWINHKSRIVRFQN